MTDEISDKSFPVLSMSMEPRSRARFVTLLQSGFFCKAVQGQTLFSFLISLPGFTREYIANRLQTIFLNGDSVDDTELAFSGSSATLALSAAMPGLAGSLFRKCSPLTALRKTAVQGALSSAAAPVAVQVKLFNVIAVEKGGELLAGGVVINRDDLLSFLELRPSLVTAIKTLTFDKIPVSPAELSNYLEPWSKILLICNSTDA